MKFKIGIIIDDINLVSKYDYEIINWILSVDDFDLSLAIIQLKPKVKNSLLDIFFKKIFSRKILLNIKKIRDNFFWNLLNRLERIFISKYLYRGHCQNYSISNLNLNKHIVEPNISKGGYRLFYKSEDIDHIKNCKLDIILRFCSGILTGKILDAANHGIVSFHHGDNNVNRGGPTGFWEVYNKQPKTGFVLQKLSSELDGGDVLFRGSFPTRKTYIENQINIRIQSNEYLKMILTKFKKNDFVINETLSYPYDGILLKRPNYLVSLKYIIYLFTIHFKSFISFKLLNKQQRWQVAYHFSSWRHAVLRKSNYIKNLDGKFFADPFIYKFDEKNYCFVEEFDYKKNKGYISVIEILKKESKYLGPIIVEDFHLSFPFIFKYEDKIYLLPESSKNKDIRLYECIDFPMQWKFKTTILNNISAADSLIFQHQDIWYLFTNIDRSDTGDHSSELSIFYSEKLFNGIWHPHPKNPIYIDPQISRNGGLINDGSQIIRVAQNVGFCQYGRYISFYKITKLSKFDFKEELIHEIKPNFKSRLKGIHHMNNSEDIVVFDFATEEKIK
jgi:hypothetical protein